MIGKYVLMAAMAVSVPGLPAAHYSSDEDPCVTYQRLYAEMRSNPPGGHLPLLQENENDFMNDLNRRVNSEQRLTDLIVAKARCDAERSGQQPPLDNWQP